MDGGDGCTLWMHFVPLNCTVVQLKMVKMVKAELCRGQNMSFDLRETWVQYIGPQLIASVMCKLQKLSKALFPHLYKENDNIFFENYFEHWKDILKYLDNAEAQEAGHRY